LKTIYRTILRINRVRAVLAFLNAFYYLKIQRKKPKVYDGTMQHVAVNTLKSNLRIVSKNIDLPKHPTAQYRFGIGLNLGNPKSDMLIEPINAVLKANLVDVSKLKVLSIGSRSLGELLNLEAHGFKNKNITGVDLFSINERILVADMHDLPFEDDYFDIVICGWVLSYSDKKEKAIAEIVRVLKNKGICSIGASYSPESNEQQRIRRGYLIGSETKIQNTKYIEDLFGEKIDKVYFRVDPERLEIHSQIVFTASISK